MLETTFQPVAAARHDDTPVLLDVTGLAKHYGTGPTAVRAIERVDFRVSRGEFVSIVGPSGAGKTTLLKCLSGLLRPTAGRAVLDGAEIVSPPATMACVFQDYSRSLLPWLDNLENVALPLKSKGLGREDRRGAAEKALGAVGLAGFEAKYPWQLSGGMQQRVAIARALAYEPAILLMDEPFASVDAQTRSDLEDLVLRIRTQFSMTILLVTHDIDEAVYLSDRIVVLSRAPTLVREVVDIPLARPRDQITTKELPAYGRLRGHVLTLVRSADQSRN